MIPFTQYLRPDGRQQACEVERSIHIEALAQAIIAAGYRFEVEHLGTPPGLPDVSLTIHDPRKEQDVAIELCRNGPEVLTAIDKLITGFAKEIA